MKIHKISLSKTLLSTFNAIVSDRRELFCRKDNCFQATYRQMAKKLGKSTKPIENLFKKLRKQGVIVDVIDCFGVKRVMLDPDIFYDHYWQTHLFMKAMYHHGSHTAAAEWRQTCWNIKLIFCPVTGETLENRSLLDVKRYCDFEGKHDADKLRVVAESLPEPDLDRLWYGADPFDYADEIELAA